MERDITGMESLFLHDGLMLGLSLALASLKIWIEHRKYRRAYYELISTPLSSLPTLLSAEASDGVQERHDTEKNEANKLVVVSGKVTSLGEDRLSVKNVPSALGIFDNLHVSSVLLERKQTYIFAEFKVILSLFKSQEVISSTKYSVPFGLTDDSRHGGGSFLQITLEGSSQPLPLTKIHSEFYGSNPSMFNLFLQVFGRKRVSIGLLEEFSVLPEGEEVTAVGYIQSSSPGTPVLKSARHFPYFLTKLSREDLITEVSETSTLYFWSGIVATTLAASVLGYCVTRNWDRLKRTTENVLQWAQRFGIRNSRNQAAATSNGDADAEQEIVGEGQLCIVCLTRQRRTVFLECGHRVCCFTCAASITADPHSSCPVCRQRITSVVRVFDA